MSFIQHIGIPKPCHEQWQQMTTVSDGRYCGHCCKTVVDFSRMSNDEILTYLAGDKNACGKFEVKQLEEINNNRPAVNKPSFLLRSIIGAATMLGTTMFIPAYAGNRTLSAQADTSLTNRKYEHKNAAARALLKKQHPHLLGITKRVSGVGSTKDTLVLRRITFSAQRTNPLVLKDTLITRTPVSMNYVIGGVMVTGIAIKEKEGVDRELLYELGIR
jgi:hypothetical protein